jgi:23S rRNA (adenine2503-C2)-methyltransferase
MLRTLPLEFEGQLHLKGLCRSRLAELLHRWGEPAYRADQLLQWIYARGVEDFSAMSNLPALLRERLARHCTLKTVHLLRWQRSERDGTVKFLLRLPDGAAIEAVFIPADEGDRRTLCISSQVGCPLGCAFCATATLRLRRNLNAAEIVDQLCQVQSFLGERITNVVFMGMGEPLLNLDAVLDAIAIFTDPHARLLSPRRITISTAGVVPGIRKLAESGIRVKLAISLHSADQRLREQLMPIARRYPLPELLAAVQYYTERIRRPVTYEYILFDGLNDSPADADALARLARRTGAKLNLIPFHPIEFAHPTGIGAQLRPSPPDRLHAFAERLRRHGVTATVRSSSGIDIDAACGQLALSWRPADPVEEPTAAQPGR